MKEYKLSARAIVMTQGSSAGTQPKYYDSGYWYKTNNTGYEGKAERLVSLLLSCTDVENYVTYEECTINGRNGCRSLNFLHESESFISFQRLYDMYKGGNLIDHIMLIDDINDRIKYVLDFIMYYTNLDCRKYLSNILTLDFITLNTDRHFHNLGIIANSETDEFRCAPIFHNGCSLLSNYEQFPADVSIEDNIEKVYGQPFSGNLWLQAKAAGISLNIDYTKIDELLENEESSRALDVLRLRLEFFKNL